MTRRELERRLDKLEDDERNEEPDNLAEIILEESCGDGTNDE